MKTQISEWESCLKWNSSIFLETKYISLIIITNGTYYYEKKSFETKNFNLQFFKSVKILLVATM